MTPSWSSAPRSSSNSTARCSARASGGSSQRNFAKSPTPAALSERTTSARSRRLTSGNSEAARCSWSLLIHNRTQRPGAVRPARPARWSAEARLIFSTSKVLIPRRASWHAMRARPLSTTRVTPSMVSDVSATLVETMILRPPLGETASSCSRGGISPCRAKTAKSRRADVARISEMVR